MKQKFAVPVAVSGLLLSASASAESVLTPEMAAAVTSAMTSLKDTIGDLVAVVLPVVVAVAVIIAVPPVVRRFIKMAAR